MVEYLAPVRERYQALRADEAALERTFAQGAEKARAIAADTLADVRRAMGVGPVRPRSITFEAVRVIDLELDLDVFAGPFDLLLTLILREEVDLLEVDLAEVVIGYIDHLERRGELDLEAATEFLVLIAALLELKSRLMLPGAESRSIELDPGRGRRGAARATARRAPLPGGGRGFGRAAGAQKRAIGSGRRRCRRRSGVRR